MGAQHRLLTPEQAAERAGITVEELAAFLSREDGPPYIELRPRTVRYVASDIDQWVKQQGLKRQCEDCQAEPGEECHPGCSSRWK
jgi:predicted DNA-binding transcriptional regulator AlpA